MNLIALALIANLASPPPALDAATQARFDHAARYSEQNGGLSVLVMKSGTIIYEKYAEGTDASEAHELASGTKSFVGVMALAAVEDGLLTLDEKVADTIHEWKEDARKSRITIRQLLNLVSGIEGGTIGRPPSYADALSTACVAEPGTKFQYGPAPFQIFGEVMRRKLAAVPGEPESVKQYLTRRVLDPIGLEVAHWRTDRDGNINLPSGALLTAREWAKFGEFVRTSYERGSSERAGAPIAPELFAELTKGTSANSRYGLTFWLHMDGEGLDPERMLQRERGGPIARRLAERAREKSAPKASPSETDAVKSPSDSATLRLFMAAGLGKQRCYVIPSMSLVVVRQGTLERDGGFEDEAFLKRLLEE